MFPVRSLLLPLLLALLPLAARAAGGGTASRAGASDFTQTQFMGGFDLGPPALLREPVRGAAEAQRGPRPGEAAAAYGERVRRSGLALGLTPAQAVAARDFYQRRHAARSPAAAPQAPPRSNSARNQRAAENRVASLIRDPGWSAPPPERAPARRLLPSEAAARLDPAIAALLRASPRRKVAPAAPPAREPAAKERTLPTAWQWMNGRGSERGETRDTYYRFAADFNRRADSITAESTGDSVGGWFSRKSYRLAAGASSIVGWLNDDAAPGRIWNGLTRAVDSANAGLLSAVRERPGQSAALFLSAAMTPMPTLTRLASAEGDRRGKRLAVSISRAATTGRTWDILDATYDTTTEVAEVASYATGVPAFMRRAALRESLQAAGDSAIASGLPRVAPRPWLTGAGTNDALAAVLETNYRRLDELNRQLLSRAKAGGTKAELDAIRAEHWKLYDENASMQREIPELRDWFASNPSPGTPGSRVFMETVAANMGVPLATLPRGVRLASANSLRRDLDAGAILPNPGKVAPEGKMTGSGAHLLLDGSPHMVSVAERLNGGIVLLMTGYADASRVSKTTRGILYELEDVADAARLPEARQVFHGPLNQLEHMVPQVPMDRVRRVRFWNAELNPADSREILFDYTEPVLLAPGADAEAILAALEKARRPNRFRVVIPNGAELASASSRRAF